MDASLEPSSLSPHLTALSTTIDSLTTALSPLLAQPLHTTTSTLPLLDKAKLYIHLCYSIESILYSSLLCSGNDNAKAHPIFAELSRLRSYFSKIADAENGTAAKGPSTKLDKDAAGRFIRAGLSGNDKFDRERAEKLAKEKARAALMAAKMMRKSHTKFDDAIETRRQEASLDLPARPRVSSSPSSEEEGEVAEAVVAAQGDAGTQETPEAPRKTKRKTNRIRPTDAAGNVMTKAEIRLMRAEKKKTVRSRALVAEEDAEVLIPEKSKAPKTPGEAFIALTEGPPKRRENPKGKGRKGK